jgi:hypothetical protein
MAGMRLKGLVGLFVSGALLVSSTGAAATASVTTPQQVSPWVSLTMLTGGAPAAALCGAAAAAAAAQPAPSGCVLPVVDTPPPVVAAPPPPVPPVPEATGYGMTPLLLGLVAIAGAIGIFFAVHGGHHHNTPISPH